MGKIIRNSNEISNAIQQDQYIKVVTPAYFNFAYSDKENIDLTKMPWLNTNNADIPNLFRECHYLKNFNISSLDLSKATSMSHMFYRCTGLTNLDLSNLNTSNITNMSAMFRGCQGLQTLNLTNFDTSNVKDMSEMFYACASLTSLDLSSFNTSNVTNMGKDSLGATALGGMFHNCAKLQEITFGNKFNTSNVTNFINMFSGCENLVTLDLSNFGKIAANPSKLGHMFENCSSLTEIKGLNLISFRTSTSKSNEFPAVFRHCHSLKSIDLSNYKYTTKSTIKLNGTFDGCYSLKHLDISGLPGQYMTIVAPGLRGTFDDVPNDCEILVKDEAMKTKIESAYSNLTNVKVKGV